MYKHVHRHVFRHAYSLYRAIGCFLRFCSTHCWTPIRFPTASRASCRASPPSAIPILFFKRVTNPSQRVNGPIPPNGSTGQSRCWSIGCCGSSYSYIGCTAPVLPDALVSVRGWVSLDGTHAPFLIQPPAESRRSSAAGSCKGHSEWVGNQGTGKCQKG